MARAKENANAQGSRDLEPDIHGVQAGRGQFTGLPARQEGYPRNGGRDARRRHLTVASATSSTRRLRATGQPRNTMLGLRIMPSSITPWHVELLEDRLQHPLGYSRAAAPASGRRP